MGQISKQIIFSAPLEKVWKVWTNVESTPEWVEGVQTSKITSTVREGKGLSWNEQCVFGKKVIQMDHEFTEWTDKKRTVIHTGLPMGGFMDRTVEFKSTGQGTEVEVVLEWDLGIVGAFFDEDKLHHMMEKSFDLTAAKWKSKAEGA